MKKLIIINILFSLTLSCSTTPDHTSTDSVGDLKKVSALSYSSSMRSIMIKSSKSPLKYCAQPEPGVGESYSSGIKESSGASTLVAASKEGVTDETSTSVVALGGRNSTLLIGREILYRVCEMGVNHNATYEQQSQAFFKAIHALVLLGNEAQAKTFASGGTVAQGNQLDALVQHIQMPVVKKRQVASVVKASSDDSDE
jgi:hypothetical protein